MQKSKLLWIISLFFPVIVLYGCGKRAHHDDLAIVDSALRNSSKSQAKAMASADSLSRRGEYESDPEKLLEIWLESAKTYQSLDLQKSLEYLYKAGEEARKTENQPADSIRTMIQVASLFNSEGFMVKEASDIFESLKDEDIPEELKGDYFLLGVQLNRTLADRCFDLNLKDYYLRNLYDYRDSVLRINPEESIVAANKLVENGDLEAALSLMIRVEKETPSGARKGPWYHYMAGLYRQMEEPDSQIKYLSLAAADDLNHGVTYHKALYELAEVVAPEDIERAYLYAEKSLKDARLSHSTKRQNEVSPVYDKIARMYSSHQKQKIAITSLFAGGMVILIITVTIVSLALRKKNNELRKQSLALATARDQEQETNVKLEKTNLLLAEEGRVKSKYIHSFMELCLSYLGKMESYRARIGKIASEGDLKKVVKAINSSRYVNQEVSEFYESFDKAFLSLYPNFFKELNSLLREEERYREGEKLSTELRVYSLIWLGIDSSGDIAKFLRCSESTVYNYRTTMRNKSINRDKFEQEFKEKSTRGFV